MAAVTNCELIDCNEVVSDLYTTATLTPAIASLVLGVSVVRLAEYPDTCFRVIKPVSPVGPAQAYTITNVFSDSTQANNCEECTENIQLYILEDCLEEASPIYTFTELSAVVGKVVKLEDDDDICRSVSTVVYDDQQTTDVTILLNDAGVPQIFADCECCLPAPEPAPVKYTRVTPKPDRKFYQIKESQCDITGNIRFAEGYYRLFKKLKYGIDSACDNINLDKLWIKKSLSDLAMINDPTACTITPAPEPIICPEPEGNPYVPPITYMFSVGEMEIGQGTLGCTTCLDGSSPGPGLVCPAFNISLDYDILADINLNAAYVFSYNGGCVVTLGSFIVEGETEGFSTYTMTSENIVDAGENPEDPCASCGG